MAPAAPTANTQTTAKVLIATNVSKTYGRGESAVQALTEVSLTVNTAELTAIMGPSGSGKSTLMHCLAGLDTPTQGRIKLGGIEVTALGQRGLTKLRRERLGFVFQAFNLIPTLTARENITLPLDIGRVKPDRDWFEAVVTALRLGDRLGHRPAELSGGQCQRVACARALITRPAVVFADEPTGNLDRAASRDLLALLRRSVEELGQSIVMVTHDPAVASFADRALFLSDGRLVDELAAPDVDSVLAALGRLERDEARAETVR
jgi:putative ABC transport system ATP-binding protein